MNNKLAIVGIFYDGYMDVWNDFINCFRRNWNDCPYEVYIVNNEKKVEYAEMQGIHVINAGADAEYSKKVQTALREIEAEYYLLMLEDFFLGSVLNKEVLSPIMEYIVSEGIVYYSLSSMSSFTKYKSELYDKQINYLYKINSKRGYTLGCQAVIWERDFLAKCVGTKNYNAWVFEGMFAKSKAVHTSEFLKHCVKDTRNVLKLKHGILQQKMIPTTIAFYKSEGFPLATTRTVMSNIDYYKYICRAAISARVPRFLYTQLKKIIKTNKGAVLDKYDREIEEVIRDNFGE